MAKHFIDNHFDLKHLVRTICTSATYQLTSMPNEYNANDKQNFSRYYPKRLPAEVLLDAIDAVTQSKSGFNGVPAESARRAIAGQWIQLLFPHRVWTSRVESAPANASARAKPTWRRACTC